MSEFNPYAAPESESLDLEGGSGIHHYKKYLIMNPDSYLPGRCVRCNEETENRKVATLTYINPWWYLLLLLNILILLIVSAFVTKKFKVAIPICKKHHNRYRMRVALGWLIFLASFAFFFMAAVITHNDDLQGIMIAIGCLLILVSVIIAITCRILLVTKFKDSNIWLRGADKRYLENFPPFQK